MSTINNNQRSKSELKGRLGKRKKDEESIEDENDYLAHSNSKAQNRHKNSEKKRKRDQSESKSSISREADQQEEDDESGDDSGDDDEDDEEEDEYDEEDEEMNDFIAPDEEVEDELQQEIDEQRRQMRGDRKKRRRKSEKARILPDEDDLDLIAENTGVQIQRKRKLRKNIDEEQSQKSDTEQMQAQPAFSAQRQKLTQRQYDQTSPYQEEEQIDTEMNQKQRQHMRQPREKAQFDQNLDSRFDADRAATARMIFEDPATLKDKVIQAQRLKEQEKEEQKGNLEELFDGDEIDDQFATRQDKAIAEKDIPEMLQIKVKDRLKDSFPNIERDIANEVEWMLHRMVDETRRENLLSIEDQVKAKIFRIIKQFRIDYMDIPYIAKYRKFEWSKDLIEEDIWNIFNLDLEYGKFQQQLGQMKATILKLAQIDTRLKEQAERISHVKNLQQLNNFSPLIKFLKSYYHKELQALPEEKNKKLPFKADNIQNYRNNKIDKLAAELFMDPMLFVENLMNNHMVHPFIPLQTGLEAIAQPYLTHDINLKTILQQAIKFQAIQLSVQPYLRAQAKKHLMNIGHLSTEPTEQGKKDLDPFHPSYRVKRMKEVSLQSFFNVEELKDIYLDIIQNEKSGLITVTIGYDQFQKEQFVQNLYEKYRSPVNDNFFRQAQDESVRLMAYEILIPDITQEIKDELTQNAETSVIRKCQETYKNLLMTGPFSCEEFCKLSRDDRESGNLGKTRKADDQFHSTIPDRPRCSVMGVILQQLDNINQIVSVAIVDKYGDVQATADLVHLMPPRKFNLQQNLGGTDEEDQRFKKAKQQHEEENKEHEADKDKIKKLIIKYQVDLIVVGANKLQARQIKRVLSSVAEGLKNYGGTNEDITDQRRNSKKRQGENDNETIREAFVIWGSLEIPKLFANSHQSKKMLKNYHLVFKQAISLARFEQDPMNEILNLWSFVPSENQTLQLNLHPLQKQINQAKLSDALEEINIKCVNQVGVDINLIIDHDHMNILLSFVSAFGPRKAKLLLQNLKSKGEKIAQRKNIFENTQQKNIYLSSVGFLKIRMHNNDKQNATPDILDQTRIHPESYLLAHKLARDLIYKGQEVDLIHSQKALIDVINNPKKLKELDIRMYSLELEKTDQQNMLILVEYIVDEISEPFKDPREYRTPTKLNISNESLFYMLIDETDKTFKKGMIVTATVSKVFDNMVLCRLDNGLDATIQKNDLEKTDDKLQKMIQPGHVVTGRIHELKFADENKFGIQLNCKKKDLESHEAYIDVNIVPKEDWVNQAFQPDRKAQQQGRFIPRRIAHPSFKNITSTKAILELQDMDIGEFIFRPSSMGENNITLTWKFYTGNIVHINIVEHEKPIGASIGSKLSINDEVFENLQEIIERYIMPCNRHVREACSNPKFVMCDSTEELERILRDEKNNEQGRIPYRLTILPNYPQHIVLGYIPKIHLIKEYIKVKPRGLFFHDKYHAPSQNLINWFKNHCNTKEYSRHQKRQRSPVAKVQKIEQPIQNESRDSQARDKKDWGKIDDQWKKQGGNSVHSMNEDNEGGNTAYAKTTNRNGDHGASRYGGNSVNPGYSEYGNTNDHQDQPRGRGDRTCYICKEPGHISTECPQKQQKSFGRGRGGNVREQSYGRGQRRPEQSNNDNSSMMDIDEGNSGNKWPQYQSSQSNFNNNNDAATGWNVDSTTQARASQDDAGDTVMGGWGQKTPSRNDGPPSHQWEPEPITHGNDFNDDRGYSPKSQRDQDEGRGRGRGRGFGRGRGEPGSTGSKCFKCQESGHMARDCPNPDTRNQGRRNACFKCNEEGHMARDCPNGDQRDGGAGRGRGRGRGGNRECHKCHQEGHFARECPNDQQSGERPYKRQRRDDGGSARRDDVQEWGNSNTNNDNQNQESGGW